jgi:hypothetical protein
MEEEAESQVRRFLTVLFVARAKRHLKALSVIYGWSPETLAEYEDRFIKTAEFVPVFV